MKGKTGGNDALRARAVAKLRISVMDGGAELSLDGWLAGDQIKIALTALTEAVESLGGECCDARHPPKACGY